MLANALKIKNPIEQEFQTKVILQWKVENMLFPVP